MRSLSVIVIVLLSLLLLQFWSGDFTLGSSSRARIETKVDNKVKTEVETDTFQSTRELASRFDVSISTLLDHLKEIGKVKTMDKRLQAE